MLQGPAPRCFWVLSGICVLWDFIFIIFFYVLSLGNREISAKDFGDQPAGAQGMWGIWGPYHYLWACSWNQTLQP